MTINFCASPKNRCFPTDEHKLNVCCTILRHQITKHIRTLQVLRTHNFRVIKKESELAILAEIVLCRIRYLLIASLSTNLIVFRSFSLRLGVPTPRFLSIFLILHTHGRQKKLHKYTKCFRVDAVFIYIFFSSVVDVCEIHIKYQQKNNNNDNNNNIKQSSEIADVSVCLCVPVNVRIRL